MTIPTENENWLIEEGDIILEKKASRGLRDLTDWEKLVYCLWIADYSMRNAGDIQTALDLDSHFQGQGLDIASKLKLTLTSNLFSLKSSNFEHQYFSMFESVCTEIKSMKPSTT